MKYLTIIAVTGLLLAVTVPAGAVTFVFDPDDLIQEYPASAGTSDVSGQNKATQPNARRTHQPWASGMYETFYNPAAPQPQPASYNTYMNWRAGLGSDEGISGFNIWLLDNPNARSWGETTVWDPNGPAPTATADAGGKWQVEVIANPWGPGWLAQWYTDDSADYINTLSDIGEFSFSGTAYRDNNQNGYDETDPEVELGEVCRIWFGAVNWTESDGGSGWVQEWSLHFDNQGWGDLDNGDLPDSWSAGLVDAEGHGSGYEGVLDITAVPEPLTMLGVLMAVGGAAGYLRRRRRA